MFFFIHVILFVNKIIIVQGVSFIGHDVKSPLMVPVKYDFNRNVTDLRSVMVAPEAWRSFTTEKFNGLKSAQV